MTRTFGPKEEGVNIGRTKLRNNKHSEEYYITPCSPLYVDRRLGGTHRLHLQGSIKKAGRLTFNGLHAVISQKMILFISSYCLRTLSEALCYNGMPENRQSPQTQ
jgi:hypothetical protein